MKYLKSYKKFEKEQLSLFDNEEGYHKKDKSQDIATKFVNTYKSDNSSSNEEHLNTSESVIKEFNNRKKWEEIIGHIIDDDRIGEYDRYMAAEIYAENNIEETVIAYNMENQLCDYFINKYDELVKNSEAKEDDITDYLQEIWDKYEIENINNVDDIIKLIKDGLIDDKDDFIEFIIKYHSTDFDYTDILDNQYWEDIIDVLRESENNEIEIFRSIILPNNMKELEKLLGKYDGVGKCWTWNEDSAESYNASYAYGGGGDQEIVIHARVHVDNVNWFQTFYRSLYTLNEEREIHLVEGVTVDIIGMDLKEKGNDLYRIKEKIINYIEKTYDFDWGKMNNIKSGYRKEIKEKSFLSFVPPIKVNV